MPEGEEINLDDLNNGDREVTDAERETENVEDREEREKLQKEIDKLKSEITDLKKDIDKFNEAAKPGAVKEVLKFVGQTIATGVIFYAVNLALAKLKGKIEDSSSSDKQAQLDTLAQKKKKIQALQDIENDVGDLAKKFQTWMTAHEKDRVPTEEGFPIPVTDILTQYMDAFTAVSSTKKVVLIFMYYAFS